MKPLYTKIIFVCYAFLQMPGHNWYLRRCLSVFTLNHRSILVFVPMCFLWLLTSFVRFSVFFLRKIKTLAYASASNLSPAFASASMRFMPFSSLASFLTPSILTWCFSPSSFYWLFWLMDSTQPCQ